MKTVLILAAMLSMLFIVSCRRSQQAGLHVSANDSTKSADSTIAQSVLPVSPMTYEETQGKLVYTKYCAVCHGQEGQGDGFNAYNLDPKPRDFSDSAYMKSLSNDQIVQTITGGGRSVNKSVLMPPYGQTLNKQQIRFVAEYVRTFSVPWRRETR